MKWYFEYLWPWSVRPRNHLVPRWQKQGINQYSVLQVLVIQTANLHQSRQITELAKESAASLILEWLGLKFHCLQSWAFYIVSQEGKTGSVELDQKSLGKYSSWTIVSWSWLIKCSTNSAKISQWKYYIFLASVVSNNFIFLIMWCQKSLISAFIIYIKPKYFGLS